MHRQDNPAAYLLLTPDPERDERYALELIEGGAAALAVEAEGLQPVIALHARLRPRLPDGVALPIYVAGGDRHALTTLRDGFGLDARPAPVDGAALPLRRRSPVAALVAPERLAVAGCAALRALDRELAGALARLRAHRRRDAGLPPALVVEAEVARVGPWEGATDYILSVDQPWPPPLEGFREQFVGSAADEDVRLEYRDAAIAVSIRPLGARRDEG